MLKKRFFLHLIIVIDIGTGVEYCINLNILWSIFTISNKASAKKNYFDIIFVYFFSLRV